MLKRVFNDSRIIYQLLLKINLGFTGEELNDGGVTSLGLLAVSLLVADEEVAELFVVLHFLLLDRHDGFHMLLKGLQLLQVVLAFADEFVDGLIVCLNLKLPGHLINWHAVAETDQ